MYVLLDAMFRQRLTQKYSELKAEAAVHQVSEARK
jgi:hypothetical protein